MNNEDISVFLKSQKEVAWIYQIGSRDLKKE